MNRGSLACSIRYARRPGALALVLASALLVNCGGSAPSSSDGGTVTGNPVEEIEPAVAVSGTVTYNLPGVPLTVSKDAEVADLDLLSSNLVPDPKSSLNYVQWFGEVRNNGTTPACFVQVTVNFKAADGSIVQAMDGYADGDSYKLPELDTAIPCIPPGKTAAVYDNDLPAAPVNLAAIALVEARLGSLDRYSNAVPHPANPELSALSLVMDPDKGNGYWVVTGTLFPAQTIYNIALVAYYKYTSGLVSQQAHAIHLDTLNAGTSWAFETLYHAGNKPASYLTTYNYLLGAKPASSALVSRPDNDLLEADGASATVRRARQLTLDRAQAAAR